ncbi:MAG: hypothetical protein PHT33_11395, partial [bacterium]|nr:hypothetical protein [bacterium]
DVYISGGTVLIDGTVNGDLVVAGGTVNVNGPVTQDVIAAGGTVTVNGRAGDDIRVAGGTVNINSPVRDDLVVAGGTVTVSGAGIGGDVLVWGGNTNLSAPVTGNVMGSVGNLAIYSRIGGSVNVNTSMLTLGPGAVVAGDLIYTSSKEATINPNARVTGQIRRNQPPQPRQDGRRDGGIGGLLLFLLWSALATIVTGLVLVYLFPRFSSGVVEITWRRFWRSLGIGFLVLVVTPIAAIILLMTVIGIPLGLILLAGWMITLYLAKVFAAIFLGWLVLYLLRNRRATSLIWALLLGAFLYELIQLIPIVGWIFLFGLFLASLGALAVFDFEHWWPRYGRKGETETEREREVS